ncbi:MAG: alkaline phosphatase family protein [Paludibacteraceae bacterium]|nr:alkaline phosphatase family protein [Paludibacteraceae bacterium]
MKKFFIHIFLLFACINLCAAPRLTIVVAVDGMHTQDLELMRPYWPQGGMRTLSEEAFQTDVTLPHLVYGGIETITTLMTGATPMEHGIAMDHFFSRNDREIHHILEDKSQTGIGQNINASPAAILSMTLSDRFRLANGDKAQIYAIGLDPYTTICMAGHSANACCWLNTQSMRFATTTYYSEGLPADADRLNTSGRLALYNSKEWWPRMDIAQYIQPTQEEKKRKFQYLGLKDGRTPAANELLIEMALNLQQSKKLGEDPVADMLLLQLTVQTPKAKADRIQSAEQEDMYLSLNQNIGYLMEQLDKRIGKSNYQLLLIGLPRLGSSADMLKKAGLPRREFNADRAMALVSTYLMALYGHERWVDGSYGQTIYLNRTLIEQKKLSLDIIRRQVSDFLMDFEGVQGACPATELNLIANEQEMGRLRQSLSKKMRGDVVFWLDENWVVMKDDKQMVDYVADRQPKVPLLLWSGSYRNHPEKQQVNALGLWSLLFD